MKVRGRVILDAGAENADGVISEAQRRGAYAQLPPRTRPSHALPKDLETQIRTTSKNDTKTKVKPANRPKRKLQESSIHF